MSRWFEVEVQVLIVCAVEVKDDENEVDAIDKASNECLQRGRMTATANPLPAEHLATIKKHAHKVLTLSGYDDTEDDDDE